MVVAGKIVIGGAAKAGMFFILATYFWHTVGELCLSPTGLSYVTKARPRSSCRCSWASGLCRRSSQTWAVG